MPESLLNRRTLLECAARLASVPAGLQLLSAWGEAAQMSPHTHSSTAPPQPFDFKNYQPQFFSPADFEALQSITALLIPTDDTPGAREAHCSEFIDFVLHATSDYAPGTQQQWRTAMRTLNDAGFHAAAGPKRAALLAEIAKPETDPSAHHPAHAAYRLIKRENAFAFYTARVGIIDNLNYLGNTYNLQFPACMHPEHHEI